MLSLILKNLSILKKFLFINSIIFIFIGSGTIFYLKTVQPNLIKKKTANHIKIINNTTEHIQRLNIKFNKDDVRKFLFSTRFLFQNLDRVQIFDKNFNLIGDTDTLDLDPRAFSQKIDIIEMNNLNNDQDKKKNKSEIKKDKKSSIIFTKLEYYSNSIDFGKPYTFTQESYDQFLLITIKNVETDTIKFQRPIYYKVVDISIFRVYRDREFFYSRLPTVEAFWKRVEAARKDPAILDEVEKTHKPRKNKAQDDSKWQTAAKKCLVKDVKDDILKACSQQCLLMDD